MQLRQAPPPAVDRASRCVAPPWRPLRCGRLTRNLPATLCSITRPGVTSTIGAMALATVVPPAEQALSETTSHERPPGNSGVRYGSGTKEIALEAFRVYGSIAAAARATGIGIGTVRRHVHDAGLPTKPGRRPGGAGANSPVAAVPPRVERRPRARPRVSRRPAARQEPVKASAAEHSTRERPELPPDREISPNEARRLAHLVLESGVLVVAKSANLTESRLKEVISTVRPAAAFSEKERKEVAAFADVNGIVEAARHFGLAKKTVLEWKLSAARTSAAADLWAHESRQVGISGGVHASVGSRRDFHPRGGRI